MSYEQQTFSSQQERIFKIIVVGDSSVGKTCLSYRFCEGKFQKQETTVGVDFRDKVVLVDNERIKLQLWDTAGQERFRQSMVAHYYRNAHAVVFVYDVTSMESFTNLTHWIDELKENLRNHSELAKILVGNQCDLIDQKVVSTSMAQKFADSYDMPLFETSAADDKELSNINGIFMTLAHKLKNQKPLMLRPLHHDTPIRVVKKETINANSESSCC